MKLLRSTGFLGLLFLVLHGEAQTLEQYFGPPVAVVPGLPDCTELAVDTEGNLLLLDQNSGMLYKYFAMTQYDSLISVGGKGNREEGFLSPSHLSVQNRQTIYLLDEAAQRIVLLTPNLRLLESVDFLNLSGLGDASESLYPVSFDVSGIGELFLLNQWDNKIYKRNQRGETERSFGGLDYGEGSLYEPDHVEVSEQNFVYVSQSKKQNIKVFDQFGLFRFTLQPHCSFHWTQFRLSGDRLLCWDNAHLYWQQLSSGQYAELAIDSLQSLALDREFLYLLRENTVHLYRLGVK